MKKSMKTVWTTLAVIVVLVSVLSLSACGNNEGSAETKSLYAQGLEIVQLMSEMTPFFSVFSDIIVEVTEVLPEK